MCVELHNAPQYWITVLCHLSGSYLSWTLPWCQSCSDIVQMWVYFTVTSLFYSALNLYLELAELGRTNTTFDGLFFTCIRQVELRPLQLLCGWLFFLKTGSWIPVIPMTFRLHITLQHLFWWCFVAAWEIHCKRRGRFCVYFPWDGKHSIPNSAPWLPEMESFGL